MYVFIYFIPTPHLKSASARQEHVTGSFALVQETKNQELIFGDIYFNSCIICFLFFLPYKTILKPNARESNFSFLSFQFPTRANNIQNHNRSLNLNQAYINRPPPDWHKSIPTQWEIYIRLYV